MYEFWYDNVKSKYEENQNCVKWVQTVSLYTKKTDGVLEKQIRLKYNIDFFE